MLTIQEFAKREGFTRQRIHQLMREGRVQPTPRKVGKYYLVADDAKILPRKNGHAR